MSGEPMGIGTDTVHDLLASGRRRRVLDHLRDADDPVLLDQLAEAVAAAEAEGVPSEDHVVEVETSLYHAHLPKLHDAGVVQLSMNPGRVSLGENAGALLRHLEDPPG